MRTNRTLALIMGLALLLAACGGDDGATTTAAAGDTTTTAGEAARDRRRDHETTAATETTAAAGDLEGVELKVWGGSSGTAEDEALTGLAGYVQYGDRRPRSIRGAVRHDNGT